MFATQKSFFQRYVFDFTNYAYLFQTNTASMKDKLTDALWPFTPDNQVHLPNHSTRAAQLREEKQRYSYLANRDELYGPVWILITLIVELLILGHISKLLKIELGMGVSVEESAG